MTKRNCAHGKQIRRRILLLLLQIIQPFTRLRQQVRKARGDLRRVRELVIDVDPVKAVVLDDLYHVGHKRRARGLVRDEIEVVRRVRGRRGVRCPADRQQELKVAVV